MFRSRSYLDSPSGHDQSLLRRRLPSERSGFSTVEMIAAIAALSVLLAMAGQMTSAMLRHRRSVERLRVAMDAKTNLMNIAMALPYDKISLDRLKSIAAELAPKRSSWEILVEGVPATSAPPGEGPERKEDERAEAGACKRIVITLRFAGSSGSDVRNRPLVAWKFRTDQNVATVIRAARIDTDAEGTESPAANSPSGGQR